MWIFTKRAFLSVVAYDPKQDREKASPFKKIAKNKLTHVLVRARVREDIEDLRIVVPNVKIVDDIAADYKYRAVITRSQWKKYVLRACDEIDYGSHFKEVVRDNASQGTARHKAMMSVWSAMIALQPWGKGDSNWGSSWAGYDNWSPQTWKGGGSTKTTTIGGKKIETLSLDELEEVVSQGAETDDSPISLDKAKVFILQELKDVPDYLQPDETSRLTPTAFALWVRVLALRSKLGKASFHLDSELLDALGDQVLKDEAEGTLEETKGSVS